jgi:hypothetical protein
MDQGIGALLASGYGVKIAGITPVPEEVSLHFSRKGFIVSPESFEKHGGMFLLFLSVVFEEFSQRIIGSHNNWLILSCNDFPSFIPTECLSGLIFVHLRC